MSDSVENQLMEAGVSGARGVFVPSHVTVKNKADFRFEDVNAAHQSLNMAEHRVKEKVKKNCTVAMLTSCVL